MGYTREFLIDAFLWRYSEVLLQDTSEALDKYVKLVNDSYDSMGKDKFRVYASLDAEEIQRFRLATGR